MLNFRLLDAQRVSHDLSYHTHLAGIVVVAAGRNLDNAVPLAPVLPGAPRRLTTGTINA